MNKKSLKSRANKSQNQSATNVSKITTKKRYGRVRQYVSRLNYLGLAFATLFYALSLLPSLLPRSSVLQGLVTGLSVVSGYGIGVLLSFGIRWATEKDVPAKYKAWAWRALRIIGPLVVLLFGYLGKVWHDEVRALVGMPADSGMRVVTMLLVAALVAVGVLALSRAVRRLFHWLQKKVYKVVPRRISIAISFVLVTMFVFWVASGLFASNFMRVADSFYSNRDNSIPEGYEQPTSWLRSGSPESLSEWDEVGYQGRKIVAGGPTVQELSKFSNTEALQPIRVYVGLKSGETAEDRAQLAVQELKRTGAFERPVLILAGTTGSGWLAEQSLSSIEYMYNGNTALVAQQYSYLPSWISYLTDKSKATEASQALYDAVFAKWSVLPRESRPKLYAYGLSLGSFGGQTPYSGVNDLRLSIDGAFFEGTPNFTRLWRNVTDNRDQGSPEWQPTYRNGETVRFASNNAEINADQTNWTYPRVLYMQHGSDPVVWFDFNLITHKPDWLRETRAPDVSPATRWYPVVSFVQLGIDQATSAGVPYGYGHQYGKAVVDSWAAVTNPPNWSQQKSDELQTLINKQL
jgi:uncharacterized membrane protein